MKPLNLIVKKINTLDYFYRWSVLTSKIEILLLCCFVGSFLFVETKFLTFYFFVYSLLNVNFFLLFNNNFIALNFLLCFHYYSRDDFFSSLKRSSGLLFAIEFIKASPSLSLSGSKMFWAVSGKDSSFSNSGNVSGDT